MKFHKFVIRLIQTNSKYLYLNVKPVETEWNFILILTSELNQTNSNSNLQKTSSNLLKFNVKPIQTDSNILED